MEADWDFEIGGDAPIIDAHWSGFVDLRTHPERVSELYECRDFPALADALARLNGADSPVWTSKTDVFTPDHFDPDEMDASIDETGNALACYIDLLPRTDKMWDSASKVERDCRRICTELRTNTLPCCRVDIVVRGALVVGTDDLGATAYFTACGPTLADAKNRLGECVMAFTRVVAAVHEPSGAEHPA